MQIKRLHSSVYKLYGYARKQETLDAYRKKYEAIVLKWDELKQAGTDPKEIPKFVGYSRSTYFRAKQILKDLALGKTPPSKRPKRINKPRWGESEKQLVLQVRRANPSYGKFKIAIILKRDYACQISESTVGRILKYLKAKGLVVKSASAVRQKRKRNFKKGHAKPWSYKPYDEMEVGERIQIDHMSVSKNGVRLKHFQAWDRRSKFMHARVYSNATSRSAKRFLEDLLSVIPFKILSIQVDGGSEFMREFEAFCKEKGITLLVLPPAKPTYNGGVERGNRIFREEFYDTSRLQADTVGAIQYELKAALKKYNTYRPHWGLDGLTPMEYIQQTYREVV